MTRNGKIKIMKKVYEKAKIEISNSIIQRIFVLLAMLVLASMFLTLSKILGFQLFHPAVITVIIAVGIAALTTNGIWIIMMKRCCKEIASDINNGLYKIKEYDNHFSVSLLSYPYAIDIDKKELELF